MTPFALKAVNEAMAALKLTYAFLTYRECPTAYPYFVGEYSEVEADREDGLQESSFLLTGFARGPGGLLALEEAKQKIKAHFTREGRVFRGEDGSIAVIVYEHAFPVPKDDGELKSIQINLTIKEWSV